MAQRPDREKAEILSEKELKELRYNLAHLSVTAVRDFYEQAYQDCRLVYNRLPSPRKMQTLVQAWKQLRKWRWAGPRPAPRMPRRDAATVLRASFNRSIGARRTAFTTLLQDLN